MATSLLNIGSRSLAAAQAALGTISHNIANVNTPGYSRQEAVLSTAAGQFTGAGFLGRGVDVTTVRRQYDQFLVAAMQANTSQASADSARSAALQELDGLFANPDLGVGAAIDDVLSAAGDMANRPADMSARQSYLGRIDQLAGRFTSMGSQLKALGDQTNDRIAYAAAQTNSRLTEIRALNTRIAEALASGQPPNDLLDQRDAALQGLQQWVSVTTVTAADGSLSIFGTQGAALLVGNHQAEVRVATDAGDPSRPSLELRSGMTVQAIDGALVGGTIGGLFQFRDTDLDATQNSLGRLAIVIADQLNSRQSVGVDSAGTPGRALFTVPAPRSVADNSNAGSGTLSITVADSAQLKASDYRLEWNGAAYTITRLQDGQTTTTSMVPATVDGLTFTMAGIPAAGDGYSVQPFRNAAAGIRTNSLSPKELATAYAASAEMAANNAGSAKVTGFQVVRQTADTTLPVAITFNNPPTSFNVTGLAGGDALNVPFVPGSRLPASPADYNGWILSLEGVPAAGDSLTISKTTTPASDNRNALALNGLADSPAVDGSTVSEAYASLIGEVGGRVQGARGAAAASTQFLEEATARKERLSGVNLDEEAANLLRYQQAYQASAKIIQASQSVFDALLAAVGR